MCSERLHPLRELLERVSDARPHGGCIGRLGILSRVGDVVDGAVELPFVLDDTARAASPILVPLDKQVGVLVDRGLRG